MSISFLPDERYKFFAENLTQSLTGLPYSFQDMDLWIECIMNLGSKLKQHWLSLLNNEEQLFPLREMSTSQIRPKRKLNLKKKDTQRKHVEYKSSRMKKDERDKILKLA